MFIVALLQQNIDPLRDTLTQYGWIGVVAWLFFREILPLLKETFSTTYKAKLAREERDLQIRAEREEKLTKVLGQFSEQLHTFGLAMTVVTERLTAIERDQDIVMRTMEILADRKQQQSRARGSHQE